MAAATATRLAPVLYGRAFEERCISLLKSRLSMTLANVGGPSDGGVDLQGWWWLPRLPPDKSNERRRIRILAQCKAFDKKLGPVHVRELEGAALLHYHTGSAQLTQSNDTTPNSTAIPEPDNAPDSTSTTSETTSELIAILISLSGFSPIAIRRAMASPVPFLLLHLPPAPTEPDSDSEPTPTLASIIWNAKLGSTSGILGGNMEIRQELGKVGHPALYWRGQKLKHWVPELEPPVSTSRFDPPAQ
ncbi:hypothetical protein FRC10_011846 [Ceratobasidium sp. 414]|nr:hypothetical protein FRC10_011846 [Ceratobasidium sp. 414]